MCEQCDAQTTPFNRKVFGKYNLHLATQDGQYMKNGQYALIITNDPDFLILNLPNDTPETLTRNLLDWYDENFVPLPYHIAMQHIYVSNLLEAYKSHFSIDTLDSYKFVVDLVNEIKLSIQSGQRKDD